MSQQIRLQGAIKDSQYKRRKEQKKTLRCLDMVLLSFLLVQEHPPSRSDDYCKQNVFVF
jgi:hypothetical protein